MLRDLGRRLLLLVSSTDPGSDSSPPPQPPPLPAEPATGRPTATTDRCASSARGPSAAPRTMGSNMLGEKMLPPPLPSPTGVSTAAAPSEAAAPSDAGCRAGERTGLQLEKALLLRMCTGERVGDAVASADMDASALTASPLGDVGDSAAPLARGGAIAGCGGSGLGSG